MPVDLLIIEADPRFRSNLMQHLVRQGIHVFEADHLQAAMKVLDQTPVDVILLDLGGFKEGINPAPWPGGRSFVFLDQPLTFKLLESGGHIAGNLRKPHGFRGKGVDFLLDAA